MPEDEELNTIDTELPEEEITIKEGSAEDPED